MSNSENQLFKCERCQTENANIICKECQPFHYFCSRCDSIVHSMRVKSSHLRQNISAFINKALNSPINGDSNYSTAKFGEINKELNLPNSSKRYFRTLTPKKQRVIYNNKLNEKENISLNNEYNMNNINYPISNQGKSYSKDYLSEINRIHNKEKEALQYKIDTLENNIERLKLNFQNEIKLMEERMNNILREKKNIEEKYSQIIDMTIKEKDEKIQLLINENNIIKEKIRILEEKGKEKENFMTNNLNECNNQIENLKNELANARKDNSILHKNHMNKVSEMVKSNNENLQNLKELHKKEVNEIYYDGKLKNEKLIQQVENYINKIDFLNNENQKMKENLEKLENDNKMLIYENQNLKDKITEYSKNLEVSRDLNNNIQKNYKNRMFNRNNLFVNNNYINNIKNTNNNEDKFSGKYTCKFEILLENDSEFQISRKVIGSKGINMKKIIDECQLEGESESVKLRLRGKGSGYKEGPQQKECDEPLHLCISTKTREQINKACFLVNKLLEKIHEEYKIFCKKYGKKPKCEKIARKIENRNFNFKFNN
jgi:hypothetical protein